MYCTKQDAAVKDQGNSHSNDISEETMTQLKGSKINYAKYRKENSHGKQPPEGFNRS